MNLRTSSQESNWQSTASSWQGLSLALDTPLNMGKCAWVNLSKHGKYVRSSLAYPYDRTGVNLVKLIIPYILPVTI